MSSRNHRLPNLSALLSLAQDAASNASEIIRDNPGEHQRVEVNLKRDVKVGADRTLETAIVEDLLQNSKYPVLTEELGFLQRGQHDPGFCWIVDPLDGSLNFSRGIPIHCISVALWEGMNPLLGVVHDFTRNETFSGLVGHGAWLNKHPIATSRTKEISQAVLCTGFPVSTDFSKRSLSAFLDAIQAYKKIRLFGSAALSLAYVGCGRADAYMENDIRIWDVAAGIALVKAAGGMVEYESTLNETTFRVKATNPYLIS